MNYYKFSQLNSDELCLLAAYTLYDITDSKAAKLRKLMTSMTGKKAYDVSTVTKQLHKKDFVTYSNYNWRTNSYDYKVLDKHMLPLMMYLHENELPLANSLLKENQGLTQTGIQQALWQYICGGFSSINKEELDKYVYEHGTDFLIPIVFDEHFANLILALPTDEFYLFTEDVLVDIFNSQLLVDVKYIRSLLASYKLGVDAEKKQKMLCLTDLYDYLAYGNVPEVLLAKNKNHNIIAAIIQLYKGDNEAAFKYFRAAMTFHNKDLRTYSKRVNYFPLSIVNYFYVIACYLEGSDTARKCALGVSKAAQGEITEVGTIVYNLLYGKATDKQLKAAIAKLQLSLTNINIGFAKLLTQYLGNGKKSKLINEWLVMKQERRLYTISPNDIEPALDHAYGKKPLLASIYHKQEWEHVLDELMQSSGTKQEEAAQRDARISYLINDIDSYYVEIKVQHRLKNGMWGAGKTASLSNFYALMIDEMTDADKRIAQKMNSHGYYSNYPRLVYVLPEMLQESRLYVGHHAPYELVEVVEVPPYINLTRTEGGFEVSSNVPTEELKEGIVIVNRGNNRIEFVQLSTLQVSFYQRLLTLGHFPLEAEEQLRSFLKGIGGKIDVNSDLIEGGSTMPEVEGTPILTVQIKPAERGNYELRTFVCPLEGGKVHCKAGNGDDVIVDCTDEKKYVRVRRNIQKEKENAKAFANVADVTLKNLYSTVVLAAYDLLPVLEYAQQNTDVVVCEWKEGSQIKVTNRGTASWNGAIKKNENGWFEIEGSVDIDTNKVISMSELLDLVGKSNGKYIKIGDNEFIAISDKLHKQLSQLNAIAARSHGHLQLSPFSAALLGPEVLNGELTLEQDNELKEIRQRIKDASKYTPEVPQTLNATLRKYQKEGYCWMARLNKWGAGALLADDMGLGKTIQTITFLLLKSEEGPALVVAPASVAPNWKTEFTKFAPSLNVSLLNFADNRDALVDNAKAGDVVITTYGLLLSVKEALTKKHWNTICLDEAHIIKNRGAKTSAVAMQLKSDNRIMLTGTPVQNHLSELWNLFQFVNPGLLGSFEDFSRRFIVPIEQNGDKVMQKELDRLVKPFMLRRTKDKVAQELPNKEEIYQHVTLSEEEMLVYEVLRRKAEAMLLSEEGNKVSMNTLAEITRLRQCSCDCRLVEEGRKGAGEKPGSKIAALLELLETILDGFSTKTDGTVNGGVLIFSQFTSYLALIKKALDAEGIKYMYIDGSVPIKTRQELVEKFQKGECPVFLISLKAGGLGLNLTRANYVIHADPWWNPAIEAQATDRAHRIGQKQAVTVYHLIAEGTIEEKIQRLHERKQALAKDILDSTDMSHKLTGEDLLEMVRTK